ncbi:MULTISPECIES: hypothetical protein [Rhizobium]|uniref:hypothetical protein n=1 Tax=Rhizobium TaxID=379 RepID=UPI000A948972|nr:hypothetical protein [Rhizobium leguminosarum]
MTEATMKRRAHFSICMALLSAACFAFPALAEVPVNDAARTVKEQKTAVCMQRARTFRQATVAPSRGMTNSVATKNDLGGMQQVNGNAVSGSPLSGSSIGNSDLSILLTVGQGATALKTRNVGQVVNALAAVSSAIKANSKTLGKQQATIGTAGLLQGALDQNTTARLSGSQIWNQAIGAANTTVQLRNQRLIDAAEAESSAAKVMTYDSGKVSFVEDPQGKQGN